MVVMMYDFCSHVNVFQGNGEIDLPTPQGSAKTWYFIKAICGNTHPGAQLPFGKYSCCLHSTGYPTGYGKHSVNCGGPINYLFDEMPFVGLSHFHQSGTGAIGVYYNYALTSPGSGGTPDFSMRKVLDEQARPGYYSCQIPGFGMECTVSEYAVMHRYTVGDDDTNIAINFTHDGLYQPDPKEVSRGKVYAVSANELRAEVILRGIPWFFVVVSDEADDAYIGERADGIKEIERTEFSHTPTVGCFHYSTGGIHHVKLAASNRSMEQALASLAAEKREFDEIAASAYETWNRALSKIEITCEDEREKEIFYSNLYHSLVKPADMTGESFIDGYYENGNENTPFIADFSTMWDIYKTQLPLVFTLYPEMTGKILETYRRFCELQGRMPHCLMLSDQLDTCLNQAAMLAEMTVADAYYRGIPADYKKLLTLSAQDASHYTEDFLNGTPLCSPAHAVDVACAHASMAQLADELGEQEYKVRFEAVAERHIDLYVNDGLLPAEAAYYEGSCYNYSFRPLPDTPQRIERYGKENYLNLVKRFFGYTHPEDVSCRFEGYNNESDMEAPAFVHYLDRDMYCEILHDGVVSMFTTGRGGLPGNNDSGGLSSCYLWNVIGLFPISGFDIMICGTPRFEKTVMHLLGVPEKDLIIRREGRGIYTKSVCFNGKMCEDFTVSVREMMGGGEMVFTMSETPVFGEN